MTLFLTRKIMRRKPLVGNDFGMTISFCKSVIRLMIKRFPLVLSKVTNNQRGVGLTLDYR
jgi:hypothetical protein